jgi:hypothetical protein
LSIEDPFPAASRPLPQARLLISRARLAVDPRALSCDLGGPKSTPPLTGWDVTAEDATSDFILRAMISPLGVSPTI